jgi:4-amino-4-deoxy-L-arabinose transferase-like glycosyltransferase
VGRDQARRRAVVVAFGWCTALAISAWALAAGGFHTRDPDSVLHTRLVAGIASQPLARWIAPAWPAGWYMSGLYREHPAGILFLPAVLARLGYPAEQAAYAVNAVYQALSIIALQRLAVAFGSGLEARTVAWVMQLLPIAFTYRVRANHEQAVLLSLLVALWATERSRTRIAWALVTALAFVAGALVKGLFVAMMPLACGLWLLARPPAPGRRRRAAFALVAACAAIPVSALVYETLYRSVTGESFLAVYLGRQLGVAGQAHSQAWLLQKPYNLLWYLARLVWFAFPWSLTALAAAWRERGRPANPGEDGAAAHEIARRGLGFCLGLSIAYLLAFSLSDRKADRYLFPAYYALGACGMVAAARASPALERIARGLDRSSPLLPVLVWVAAFAAHIAAGRLHPPRIKLWPSD